MPAGHLPLHPTLQEEEEEEVEEEAPPETPARLLPPEGEGPRPLLHPSVAPLEGGDVVGDGVFCFCPQSRCCWRPTASCPCGSASWWVR